MNRERGRKREIPNFEFLNEKEEAEILEHAFAHHRPQILTNPPTN